MSTSRRSTVSASPWAHARTESRSARSIATSTGSAPVAAASTCSRAAVPFSGLRHPSSTVAPARASASAERRPSPLLAPVTSTVRPDWSGISAAVHLPMPAKLPGPRPARQPGCEPTDTVTPMWAWGAGGRAAPRLQRILACAAGVAIVAAACASGDGDSADDVEPQGETVGRGDTYEAVIRRTDGGVPHITGDSTADVSFGQGWASGEDRACDLADQVVKIRGERARWFGPGEEDANVDSDIAWRAIGIFDRASSDWADATPRVVESLTAFTEGWNAHLEDVGVDGLAGWCAGAPWVRPIEPVELYAYARSVALSASSGVVANFIASAQPPAPAVTPAPSAANETAAAAPTAGRVPTDQIASNGWAVGADRSADGGGLLLANPHFPWEGERRFWESHLTVPGELDIYGAQLSGLPGIGIGFTEEFGWTHTVSAGNRFTAYRLELVPGAPTTYRYGDEQREMTPTELTVDVLRDDGTIEPVTRTLWSSHYGWMIDFPGVGWTEETALTFRDANLENDEFADQYLGMLAADDFDEFVDVHREVQGVPLFNTIAV